MNDETMMTAEEFFGEIESQKKTPARKGKSRGRKSRNDLFAEAKIKMVMRIYGATRKGALGIIAGREAERQALERAKERQTKHRESHKEERLMTAEEFFGGGEIL